MRTYLSVEHSHPDDLPARFGADVRMPAALAETLIEAYSDPGDSVVDVFAGFGTTLSVAERLGRVPYGLEYDADRVEYVRGRIESKDHVRQGDILDADLSAFPACECCVTSPPFMERTDDRNPFRNYAGESSYDAYLDDIEAAFRQLDGVLADGGRVVVGIANMKHEGRVTPLAWDVAERVSSVFQFDGERVVVWEGDESDGGDVDGSDDRFGYGYDHSYCLVFTKA